MVFYNWRSRFALSRALFFQKLFIITIENVSDSRETSWLVLVVARKRESGKMPVGKVLWSWIPFLACRRGG